MTAPDAWTVADPTACAACGRDACDGTCQPPTVERATSDENMPRLSFQTAADVMRQPAPEAIVEGLAWAGQVTLLVAEPGAGKTFLALGIASAVTSGVTWIGRRTTAGTVAYLSFEGDALGLRLRALRDVQGHRLDHLRILRPSQPISPRLGRDGVESVSTGEFDVAAAVEALRGELEASGAPPIRLVVVDTVRASLAGSEDDSSTASGYLRAVRRLLAQTPGAAALLIHHAGWQDGEVKRKRERGSSAWRGNADAVVYLEAGAVEAEREGRPIVLRALKVRDVDAPAPLSMVRRAVELDAFDVYGCRQTSCVIDRDTRTPQEREATKAAELERVEAAAALDVLRAVATRPEAATTKPAIRAAVRGRAATVYAAIDRLVASGHLTPPAGKRGTPYVLTDEGREALHGADASHVPVPTRSHRFPGTVPPSIPVPPLKGTGMGTRGGMESMLGTA